MQYQTFMTPFHEGEAQKVYIYLISKSQSTRSRHR